ncbi:MAG TPA: YbgA family protein, partial [Candidatus Binatia bacterium]|nr:YbgA family protein [Candidatus Binatia bacterium]
TIGDVVVFHTAHKLELMAHSPRLYAELGRLVAVAKAVTRPELRASYEAQFMSALEVMATPKRHVNVLQHILGYVSDRLDSAARREIIELIEDYGRGILPLVVPLTLVRHYVRHFAISYLQKQTYLEPHPKELMLRNHV